MSSWEKIDFQAFHQEGVIINLTKYYFVSSFVFLIIGSTNDITDVTAVNVTPMYTANEFATAIL